MKYSLFDINQIENLEIRSYFSEVISCYEHQNYRAAILVLYTVILYDLTYKLEELRDEYEDSNAKQLLEEVHKKINSPGDKSSWENLLLDKLYESKDFEIVDDNLWSTIQAVKLKRNLSAHPSFDKEQQIYQPTRELTLGFIKEIYETLLTKSAHFMSRGLERIFESFDEKKSRFSIRNFYENSEDNNYEYNYFYNRFYSRMSIPLKKKFFKSVWELTFEKNNVELEKNFINLFIIIKVLEQDEPLFKDFIEGKLKSDKIKDVIDLNIPINKFILFLNFYPHYYNYLQPDVQRRIVKKFKEINHYLVLWYTKESIPEYISMIMSDDDIKDLDLIPFNQIKLFNFICKEKGILEVFNKFVLKILEKYVPHYNGFDNANIIMNTFIIPYLNDFKAEDYFEYARIRKANYQISGRDRDSEDNRILISKMKEQGFDYHDFETQLKL